jgi:SSS family solute:Na+ symporter
VILTFILLYAAALVVLGFFVSRRVKEAGTFYVAGRKLSTPLLLATFLAANLGAGTTVGAAEFGYVSGLSAWWWVGSAGLGSLLLAFFVGPRIYRLAARHNLYTVGDYLELRYSRAVRLLMASVLWLASLSILAGQLIAIGIVMQVVAGVPQVWGCVLGGLIVTLYFTAGGLLSTAWINLVQVFVKAVGFCLAVPWALSAAGGWDALQATLTARPSVDPSYFSMTGIGLEGILRYAVILVPAFFVSPGLLQKLYGARDESTVRRAVGAQGLCLLVYSFMPVILGMVALVRFPDLAATGLALPKLLADTAVLPAWLGGLMLAAIFSAEVSSADAVLFMISTSVSRDWVQSLVRPSISDQGLLRVTRVVAVLSGIAGVLLAIRLQSVLAALEIFYSLLVVTLFVPLIAGLYSSRPTAGAALASMVSSVPFTFAIHRFTEGQGWGILTPAALGIVCSAVTFALFCARAPFTSTAERGDASSRTTP